MWGYLENASVPFPLLSARPLSAPFRFSAPRQGYEIGVPEEGFYEEILNTDSELFGGSNIGNGGLVSSRLKPCHNRPYSIAVTLPPAAVVIFRKR